MQSMRLWDRQAKLGESADLDGWWVGGEQAHGVTAAGRMAGLERMARSMAATECGQAA